jgi:diguanylate cyclase (GGDEF)-like protein
MADHEEKFSNNNYIWTQYFVKISVAVIVFAFVIFIALLTRNNYLINNELETRAKDQIQHIIKTRSWNAHYGGVYVEKKEGMQSNPYLEAPDIETTDGKIFTMKNPALMTREISELFENEGFLKFRMTSLNPLNPTNIPDAFEREALGLFEKGEKELSRKEENNDATVFRYMIPLVVEESCLQCHAKQGYKEGDIRGGISVEFDITDIENSLRFNKFIILLLGTVSAVSLLGIVYALTFVLMRRLEKAQEKIEELAITDELTRLFNRRFFFERLRDEVKRAVRFGLNLSLIMIDIDYFKNVNDTHGHQAGDVILKNISNAVKNCCRQIDTVARYGGEEIIVLLPGTDLKGAYHLAEKIRVTIESSKNKYNGSDAISVTVSSGVASFTSDDLQKMTHNDQMIRYVDEALYRAKEKGRNRVEVAESVIM